MAAAKRDDQHEDAEIARSDDECLGELSGTGLSSSPVSVASLDPNAEEFTPATDPLVDAEISLLSQDSDGAVGSPAPTPAPDLGEQSGDDTSRLPSEQDHTARTVKITTGKHTLDTCDNAQRKNYLCAFCKSLIIRGTSSDRLYVCSKPDCEHLYTCVRCLLHGRHERHKEYITLCTND